MIDDCTAAATSDPIAEFDTGNMPASSSRTVMVTGGHGMIGRSLVQELASAGCKVLAPSRSQLDLADRFGVEQFMLDARPELVFHLAARVAGLGGNLAAPRQMFYDNLLINTNVVEASRKASVTKIVAVGSAAIYSDTTPLPMSEDNIWMGPPHHSEGPYGHAKRTMLAQLEAYAAGGDLDYAYCVLTNTYGPHDTFDERFGHVVPSLISKFWRAQMRNESVVIWGNGSATRDFLFSPDVARALMLIAEGYSGAINVASGRSVSIRHLVDILRHVAGYDRPVIWDETKPNGQALRAYDISRLTALGFDPQYGLEEGLAETYRWFSENVSDMRATCSINKESGA